MAAPGRPLDARTRAFFEPCFGHDFSNIRIHDDAAAAASAHVLQAEAYTVGDHVAFAHRQYDPGGTAGRRLLAHELAHVVQQRAAGGTAIQRQPRVKLVNVEDLPPEVQQRLDPTVHLPTASLEGYNPDVGVDDQDRRRSLSMKLQQVRNSPEYVDNGLVSVRPRGDIWTLEIFDLTFEYADGRTLTLPWGAIEQGSAAQARSYRRQGGVIYPLGSDHNPTYDAENTPQIAGGARMIYLMVVRASEDRLEMAELVYTFSGLIAASSSTLSAVHSFSQSSAGSRRNPPKLRRGRAGGMPEKTGTTSEEAPSARKTPTAEKSPPVPEETAAPSTRLLGPGEDFSAHVQGSDGVLASLGKDGILDLYIKAGPSTPRGGQMFGEALNAYGSNVRGIRGTWLGGGDLSSNFDSFQAAVGGGMRPTDAARATFTGKMADRAGFTNVKIVTNTSAKVVVEFTK